MEAQVSYNICLLLDFSYYETRVNALFLLLLCVFFMEIVKQDVKCLRKN